MKFYVPLVLWLLCCFPLSALAGDGHPETFIGPGCPFEGCTYQSWTVAKDTIVYEKPSQNSKALGTLKKGTKVEGKYGEVHSIAAPFLLDKDYRKDKAGETIWLYTYYGLGFFDYWSKGKFKLGSFGLSPYGGLRCTLGDCVGALLEKPKFTWWAKVSKKQGLQGWANGFDFTDQDGFGEYDVQGWSY